MRLPMAMDDYLFDLRGYLILRNAVDAGHIAALNAVLKYLPSNMDSGGATSSARTTMAPRVWSCVLSWRPENRSSA